jgi:hypothetical protein
VTLTKFAQCLSLTRDLLRRIGPEVLKELEKKNPKSEKGNRKNKHHQWLTEADTFFSRNIYMR